MKSKAARTTTLNELQPLLPVILSSLAAAFLTFIAHPQPAVAAIRLVTSNCASPCTTATSCHATLALALAASQEGVRRLVGN